jgi:3D-(3,5/4)-trihydroxycyclohexane-1,2-dione acylhydrolase (decyclizing)
MAGPVGATGGIAGNRLAAAADLVIAVGTRLSDFTTASKTAFQNPDVSFIGLNVAPFDATKHSGFPLVGDARSTLESLAAALRETGYRTDEGYAAEVKDLKVVWDKAVDLQRHITDDQHLTQAQVIGIVNEFARPKDVLVCASGGLPGDLHKLWRTADAKGYHVEYGYSCMGYEIAGGHGVKMADPSREVYVLVGDGSYLMLHTEIVTSLQEGNKITVVVLDNSGFQCIRSLQQSLGSPSFSNEMRYRSATTGRLEGGYVPIDFVKNAESLGARAYLASTPPALREALEHASGHPQTVVIHVPVDVDARVPSYEGWWDVPVAEVSDEPAVRQARHDYELARMRQRYF